ncbi:GntR family transcriptional regulator [Bradyrhizobium diazoefficiens]
MAVSYEFKPGERLNEGELAKRLGVSRTPLREALNRLNTEGFLRFTPGKGLLLPRARRTRDLRSLRAAQVDRGRFGASRHQARQGRGYRRALEISRGNRSRSRRALLRGVGRAG